MRKVRINREAWACGKRFLKGKNRNETNLLYDSTTNGMCCLGFATSQLSGIPECDLDGRALPREFSWEGKLPEEKLYENFGIPDRGRYEQFELDAVRINDDSKLSTTRREKRITNHFKKYGIEVEFYGEYK